MCLVTFNFVGVLESLGCQSVLILLDLFTEMGSVCCNSRFHKYAFQELRKERVIEGLRGATNNDRKPERRPESWSEVIADH